MAEMTAQIPTERFLEVLATRLDAAKAADRRFAMNLALDDVGERYVIWLKTRCCISARRQPRMMRMCR
jgi:alkyl sulfatase BDS1-like metallo-beta-lactamase superfamily hydrolase